MSSQARPRRTRRSYANFFAQEASNENQGAIEDASESDFEPEPVNLHDAPMQQDSSSEEDLVEEDNDIAMEEDDDDLGSIAGTPQPKPSRKANTSVKHTSKTPKKGQSKPLEVPSGGQSLANVSRPQRPGPGPSSTVLSKDHRHRPECPWYPPAEVYRLTECPYPCSNPTVSPTISTGHRRVIHRVKKAWMYCVSAGPRWELLEDRAFFKEEYHLYNPSSGVGRRPRPMVYSEISSPIRHTVLTAAQSAQYLPRVNVIRCELGPLGSQQLLEISPFSSVPMRLLREGDTSHVFYPGGPVVGADWCPSTAQNTLARDGKLYFAVSTLMEPSSRVPIGLKCPTPSPASIQIWSIGNSANIVNPGIQVRGELLLCIDEGSALQLKWCPLPSQDQRLGILGAVTMDGNVNLYMVPDPTSFQGRPSVQSFDYVKIEPIVRLSLPDTACNTFDWANSEVIAAGCSNGAVAVFYVKDAISKGENATLTHYFSTHQAAVQNVCWIRLPRADSKGMPVLIDDPVMVCTVGSEGTLKTTDIRDCLPRTLVRNREVPHSNSYSSFCGSVVTTDVDFLVKMYQLQPVSLGKGHNVMDVGGAALSVSTSDMHPIVAAGSADGACTTTNILRGTRKEGAVPLLNHKIFQLDFNPTTSHYRMLDHLLPRENGTSEGPSYRESAPKAKVEDPGTIKQRFETGQPEPSALWHPSISVNVVTWNSGCGLGSAPFLLSGMACGLARVDFLEGTWMRNTLPYGSIEMIRQEGVEDAGSDSQSE